jgi:hypothetical protein
MQRHAEHTRRREGASRGWRSVSLEHDHAHDTSSRRYILTACARRAIQRIADGIARKPASGAWTLTGPFGTGKSSFCVFLSHLLSAETTAGGKAARQSLKEVDPATASALRIATAGAKSFVPVIVTGSREPLAAALARGLSTALEASPARGARRLANDLRQGDADLRRDPVKMLDTAASCLVSSGAAAGVLLIIDELGKLLEYAAANPSHSDVYVLQRLAEHAVRASTPTLLIGVLHQDFSGYARELPDAQQQEWEKVRGRFEDILFEQSADDMLRLIAQAMMDRRADNTLLAEVRKPYESLCERVWATKVAPPGLELSHGKALLASCYPLHPCVTLLLGPIFKRFGQNERSAFSFLTSGEPHALAEFRATAPAGQLYTLVDLYQYLVGTFGDALLSSKDGKRWAEAFNVEAQHHDLNAHEAQLLRTTALLGIVGRWNGMIPTPPVLEFALSPTVTPSDVRDATQSLTQKSAIVYRRFNDTYNLWEGSDIDVEARIADARSRIAADASAAQLLQSHFTPRPLVARRHSFEFGTLRYFDVIFATATTLQDRMAAFDAATAKGTTADGQIVMLLPELRRGTTDTLASSLPFVSARQDTLLCIPGAAGEIESLARELSAVQWVRSATADLQSDATARRELAAREQDVRRRLEVAVASVLAPPKDGSATTRWFYGGRERKLSTPRALNELLSTICDEVFSAAPNIQNEIINRRELSSSAASAQGNLIEHMLREPTTEGLGIEGSPPQRSIYLSVLHALHFHHGHHGKWAFASSAAFVRKDARPLYKAIRSFFDSAGETPRRIDELFTLLRRPPFGLRNGVIPLFVCAALLGNEADVALYEDAGFLPQLTDAIFARLIKEPSRYTVRRWQVSGVRVSVFEQLGKMLGKPPLEGQAHARDLLDIVKPLLRFVRKLNPFARQTKTFAPMTVAVREALANASEPDQLLFHALPHACGIAPFSATRKERSEDVASFLRTLQQALVELQRGYDTLLLSVREELAQALGANNASPRPVLMPRAAAVVKVALNPEIKVFTARLADGTADDTVWIEQLASFLASKHPTLWNDDDRGRFTVRLAQMADAFASLESLVLARRDLRDTEAADESIRISVVGTRCPQADQVVHLSGHEAEQVTGLEKQLQAFLEPHAKNGSRKLVFAALARVAQSMLQADSTTADHVRGPK